MGLIKILPDNLVNQIAAGEVVERPSSVVKELLENALDAGASRITIELDAGGRDRIMVEDDGAGMDGDDLLMALERHATSKIGSEGDLFAIGTLGFRGEALPSIASVSRLTLASKPAGAEVGTRLTVAGGRYGSLEPAGLARGTRAEVRDLFFNVPARRKFLRSPSTEMSHVIAVLEHYALARPSVALRLLHQGREVMNLAPSISMEERFFALFPEIPREDFIPVRVRGVDLSLEGLAGKPERNLGSPRYQFTLVNGRFVRDRLLQHAIASAYEDTHPKGRHPMVLLALEIPPGRVDVNVHPTKREVRFTEGHTVHEAVAGALRRAIAPGRISPAPSTLTGPFPGLPRPSVAEAGALFGPARSGEDPPVPGGEPLSPSPLRAIAQWRSSFILCDGPEGLAIVDQHVAHERIRYEEFGRYLRHGGPRQAFLSPRVYALPLEVRHAADQLAGILTAQGFESETFGEGVVAVRSAPAFLPEREVDGLLSDFVTAAGEVVRTPERLWQSVLILRSCRGSVMLGDPLDLSRMQYLLDRLHSLGAPLTCPHGRPIVFTLKEREILSRFGR